MTINCEFSLYGLSHGYNWDFKTPSSPALHSTGADSVQGFNKDVDNFFGLGPGGGGGGGVQT